eukprot:scaffold528_cov165-Amphora_coffeaeformis.AAC.52
MAKARGLVCCGNRIPCQSNQNEWITSQAHMPVMSRRKGSVSRLFRCRNAIKYTMQTEPTMDKDAETQPTQSAVNSCSNVRGIIRPASTDVCSMILTFWRLAPFRYLPYLVYFSKDEGSWDDCTENMILGDNPTAKTHHDLPRPHRITLSSEVH